MLGNPLLLSKFVVLSYERTILAMKFLYGCNPLPSPDFSFFSMKAKKKTGRKKKTRTKHENSRCCQPPAHDCRSYRSFLSLDTGRKDEDELRRADKDDTKKKKSGRAILSLALYRTLSSPNWIPRPSSLLPVKMRFRRIRREFPERFKSLERGCSSKQSVSRYCVVCTVHYMVS